MLPNYLTNFKLKKYYQSGHRFHCVYSRDNLPKKSKAWGICNKS